MAAKFTFFQEVKVVETAKRKKYRGLIGYITAIGEPGDTNQCYTYDVSMLSDDLEAGFREDELEATGNFKKYEDFYDGSYARVSQDGELLELHIVDRENEESMDSEKS